ncbi:MAG: hypothetical protein WC825_05975 [Gallionellaceae bacterium]|jgi:hypothetical protein
MASLIDATKPVAGTPTTASVRANFAAAKAEIEALQAQATLTWLPVTFLNGWVNFGAGTDPCEYCIDEKKIVRLRGMAKNGTIGTPMFTLPAGMRPTNDQYIGTVSDHAFGEIAISSAGDVYASTGSIVWFSLAGISFQAA